MHLCGSVALVHVSHVLFRVKGAVNIELIKNKICDLATNLAAVPNTRPK